MPSDQPQDIALVEECAKFAQRFGVDHMLDVIAGVHQAYAGICTDPSIRTAYELAGIDLDGVVRFQ